MIAVSGSIPISGRDVSHLGAEEGPANRKEPDKKNLGKLWPWLDGQPPGKLADSTISIEKGLPLGKENGQRG